MTVKELMNILKEMPQDGQVAVRNDDYVCGLSADNITVHNENGKYIWIVNKNDIELIKIRKSLWQGKEVVFHDS